MGNNETSTSTLLEVPSDVGGRPARSLLSKPDNYMSSTQHTDKSFSYIPFLNFNNIPSLVSPAIEPVDEPVDGDKTYAHDPIDDLVTVKRSVVSTENGLDEKVIHMEITKLPDELSATEAGNAVNKTQKDTHIPKEDAVRHRHITMEQNDD